MGICRIKLICGNYFDLESGGSNYFKCEYVYFWLNEIFLFFIMLIEFVFENNEYMLYFDIISIKYWFVLCLY